MHISLIELRKFSGLQLNKGKSRVYFDGIADHDKAAFVDCPDFNVVLFPQIFGCASYLY